MWNAEVADDADAKRGLAPDQLMEIGERRIARMDELGI
jgi:hypothetical protein